MKVIAKNGQKYIVTEALSKALEEKKDQLDEHKDQLTEAPVTSNPMSSGFPQPWANMDVTPDVLDKTYGPYTRSKSGVLLPTYQYDAYQRKEEEKKREEEQTKQQQEEDKQKRKEAIITRLQKGRDKQQQRKERQREKEENSKKEMAAVSKEFENTTYPNCLSQDLDLNNLIKQTFDIIQNKILRTQNEQKRLSKQQQYIEMVKIVDDAAKTTIESIRSLPLKNEKYFLEQIVANIGRKKIGVDVSNEEVCNRIKQSIIGGGWENNLKYPKGVLRNVLPTKYQSQYDNVVKKIVDKLNNIKEDKAWQEEVAKLRREDQLIVQKYKKGELQVPAMNTMSRFINFWNKLSSDEKLDIIESLPENVTNSQIFQDIDTLIDIVDENATKEKRGLDPEEQKLIQSLLVYKLRLYNTGRRTMYEIEMNDFYTLQDQIKNNPAYITEKTIYSIYGLIDPNANPKTMSKNADLYMIYKESIWVHLLTLEFKKRMEMILTNAHNSTLDLNELQNHYVEREHRERDIRRVNAVEYDKEKYNSIISDGDFRTFIELNNGRPNIAKDKGKYLEARVKQLKFTSYMNTALATFKGGLSRFGLFDDIGGFSGDIRIRPMKMSTTKTTQKKMLKKLTSENSEIASIIKYAYLTKVYEKFKHFDPDLNKNYSTKTDENGNKIVEQSPMLSNPVDKRIWEAIKEIVPEDKKHRVYRSDIRESLFKEILIVAPGVDTSTLAAAMSDENPVFSNKFTTRLTSGKEGPGNPVYTVEIIYKRTNELIGIVRIRYNWARSRYLSKQFWDKQKGLRNTAAWFDKLGVH